MRPKHCCNVRHPGRCHRRILRQAMQLLRSSGKLYSVFDRTEPAEASSDALLDRAETISSHSATMDVQTAHDKARANAKKAANQLGRIFTDCIESGRISKKVMFDRYDQPTRGTDPQAHRSTSDVATECTDSAAGSGSQCNAWSCECRAGSGLGWNRRAFLLQTHKRDPGEVMHDIAMPICVNGMQRRTMPYWLSIGGPGALRPIWRGLEWLAGKSRHH